MQASSKVVSVAAALICGMGCGNAPETSQDSPVPIPTTTASATDYTYDAPDTVSAGLQRIRFVNRDDQGHSLTVVRVDGGRTLRDWIEAYREANRTAGPRPEWATFHGGTGLFGSGEASVIVDLVPGDYGLVCFMPGPSGTSHLLEHDEAHAFSVVPGQVDAAVPNRPEPTATVRMLDYSYELSAPLVAGPQVIHVENVGVDPHHVLLFRMLPGRTQGDFQAWLETGLQSDPPAEIAAALSELSTGADAYLEADLQPGDYVLVCLVAGHDEVPHAAKGMISHIAIG